MRKQLCLSGFYDKNTEPIELNYYPGAGTASYIISTELTNMEITSMSNIKMVVTSKSKKQFHTLFENS